MFLETPSRKDIVDIKPIIPDIAAALGFEGGELATLLIHLAPSVLIQRKGLLFSNVDLVVEALDSNNIPIPRDPRRPQSYFRNNPPSAPLITASAPPAGAQEDERPVEGEVIDTEIDEQPQQPTRPPAPARRHRRHRRQ